MWLEVEEKVKIRTIIAKAAIFVAAIASAGSGVVPTAFADVGYGNGTATEANGTAHTMSWQIIGGKWSYNALAFIRPVYISLDWAKPSSTAARVWVRVRPEIVLPTGQVIYLTPQEGGVDPYGFCSPGATAAAKAAGWPVSAAVMTSLRSSQKMCGKSTWAPYSGLGPVFRGYLPAAGAPAGSKAKIVQGAGQQLTVVVPRVVTNPATKRAVEVSQSMVRLRVAGCVTLRDRCVSGAYSPIAEYVGD